MAQPKLKTRQPPLRRCVGCGEMTDKKGLIKISLNKEGEFQVNPPPRSTGRSAYLCNSKACFKTAKKNKGLERSFKRPVPAEVYAQCEQCFL